MLGSRFPGSPKHAEGEQACEAQPLPDPLPAGEVSPAWACCFVSERSGSPPCGPAGRVTAAALRKPRLLGVGRGGVQRGRLAGLRPTAPGRTPAVSLLFVFVCLRGTCRAGERMVSSSLLAERQITMFGSELSPGANSRVGGLACSGGGCICSPAVSPARNLR